MAVAHFAIEATVGSVIVSQTVQKAVALQAAEAVLVIPQAGSSDHLFGLKNFSVALGATIHVALLGFDDPSLDSGARQNVILLLKHLGDRPAECSCSWFGTALGSEFQRVARLTIDLVIRTFATGHGVEFLIAVDATETWFVITAHTCHHPFCLKDLSTTPGTGQLVVHLSRNGLDIHPAFVFGLLPVTKLEGIKVLAVYLPIIAIVKGGRIQISPAVVAREAVLVNNSTFGVHLFGLENFSLASDASLW